MPAAATDDHDLNQIAFFVDETEVRWYIPPDHARLGTVIIVLSFGSDLNKNIRFRRCVIDGVFNAENETVVTRRP